MNPEAPRWLVNPNYRPKATKLHWISFGDLARHILREQCQYACRYLDGYFLLYPKLGLGLRWLGSTANYHQIQIEWSSAYEFVFRYVMWGLREQWLTDTQASEMLTNMLNAKLENFTEP